MAGKLPSGSPTRTVAADDNSVVVAREIKNTKTKSLCVKIETVSAPGTHPPGNVSGQAHFTAFGGGVICADKISDSTFDGDINLTVSVKTPQIHTGTADETLCFSQETDPAVKMITEHKPQLISHLMADHSFILQCVHAKHIISDRQYQNMKSISQPEETVTNLIDQVIFGGPESSRLFLELLKFPEVLETYPQLKQITAK